MTNQQVFIENDRLVGCQRVQTLKIFGVNIVPRVNLWWDWPYSLFVFSTSYVFETSAWIRPRGCLLWWLDNGSNGINSFVFWIYLFKIMSREKRILFHLNHRSTIITRWAKGGTHNFFWTYLELQAGISAASVCHSKTTW